MVVIDYVVQSILTNIKVSLKDYFEIDIVYTSDESNAIETYMENMNANRNDNTKTTRRGSRALLIFNREPLQIDDKQRQVPRAMLMDSSSELKKFNIKEFFFGKTSVNCVLISPTREHLSLFEAYYLMHLKQGVHVMDIGFNLPDIEEPLETDYNLVWDNMSNYRYLNYSSAGSLSGINFRIDVDGIIFMPDFVYYPKLIDIKVNYIVPPHNDLEKGYDMTTKIHNVLDDKGNFVDVETTNEKNILNIWSVFKDRNS